MSGYQISSKAFLNQKLLPNDYQTEIDNYKQKEKLFYKPTQTQREKISQANFGRLYNPIRHSKISETLKRRHLEDVPFHKKSLLTIKTVVAKLAKGRGSKIETKVYRYLIETGFNATQIKRWGRIGRYEFDLLVIPLGLVIEVQGSYWHKTEVAKNRDRIKKAKIISEGYELLYLLEEEINDNTFRRKLDNLK